MSVIRTPDLRTFRIKNHHLDDGSTIYYIIYAGYKNIPLIRTYITTPKGVLIAAFAIYFIGYKNT